MAQTSPTRSALKSSFSPRRTHLNVSFQDPSTSTSDSSRASFSSSATTPISNSPSIFKLLKSSPFLKSDSSDHSSSADGHSIEEITCLDVDDILPKTDYTYARTASYSPKFLRKKRYISPNMSRRRLDGQQPSFLSDDEEDYDKEFDYDDHNVVITKSNDFNFEDESNRLDMKMNLERPSRARKRSQMIASSQMTPHGPHHISTHDHYYDGMLLRSGSHVKGSRRHLRQSSSDSSVGTYYSNSPVLAPTYRSDIENVESSRRNRRTITTVTTTTDTSFEEEEEEKGRKENNYLEDESEFLYSGESGKTLQTVSESYQKSQDLEEDSERKLFLDENETEKTKSKRSKRQIRLRHLDGLDYGEDISDVDDYGSSYSYKHSLANRQPSLVSRISSFFIMIITTLTTTITESTKQVVSPVAASAFSTLTSPVRWIGRAIISTCSWIYWNSSSVLLLDIEAKQRRKRGCCCCLLPLLLLLPFALLGGYYSAPMREKVGTYLSTSEAAISTYWSSLWITPAPVFVAPAKQSESDANYQMDMTKLDQHIHQTILMVMNQKQKEQLQGLTVEQVEAIAKAIVTSQLDVTEKKFNGDVISLKDVVGEDISNLRATLAALGKDMQESDQGAKVLAGNLDAAKIALESLSQDQRAEWLAVAEALEGKLLDMRNELNEVTNQNLALTTMLKSCCLNNSMITETVHSQLMAFFSQMDNDTNSAAAAGLLSLFGNEFAKKDDLDEKVSVIAAEITEKMRIALASQAEEIQGVQARTNDISQESIFSKIDKEKDSAAIASLMSLFGSDFVKKDELDERLSAIAAEISKKMRIELNKQAEEIQLIQTKANEVSQVPIVPMSGNVDELVIKGIVEDALLKFSADGIGKPDFALESAGGSVLNIRCSETYYRKTALVSVFGLPLWYTSNSPRTVIQPSVHPGECWAFRGSAGLIVIQLSQPVQPTGFTLEHIPRSLSPSGNIDSAPQDFSVFGLTADNDLKGVNLGNYTYSNTGRPVQHFPIQRHNSGVYQFVELRVLSNYGNAEYTCLYRFRVHGVP